MVSMRDNSFAIEPLHEPMRSVSTL
jgi:hypothetical protein